MEIKKQVILRSVAGEHMLIPVGETVFQYNGIFMLTESGKSFGKISKRVQQKTTL